MIPNIDDFSSLHIMLEDALLLREDCSIGKFTLSRKIYELGTERNQSKISLTHIGIKKKSQISSYNASIIAFDSSVITPYCVSLASVFIHLFALGLFSSANLRPIFRHESRIPLDL